MPDPKPLEGDDPYEKIGVSENEPLDAIEAVYEQLKQEYAKKANEGREQRDRQKAKEAMEALRNLDDAWEVLEANHEPPGVDKPLSLSVRESDISVDETVTVEVTSRDGPEERVTVQVDRDGIDPKTTDQNGRVRFTFSERGPVEVTALTTPQYDDPSERFEISRRTLSLTFSRAPNGVEIGESATFEIVDGDGNSQEDVRLVADGDELGKTGRNGTAHVTFQDVGSVTITAEKPPGDKYRYRSAETWLNVTEETVELNLIVSGSNFEYGDTVEVKVVTDDGTPVENAAVSIGGDVIGRTGVGGQTEVDLEQVGTSRLTSSKTTSTSDRVYEDSSTSIRVGKQSAALTFDHVGSQLIEGSDVTVRIADDTGSVVSGARIISNQGHDQTTDASGEAVLTLKREGELELKATKASDTTEYAPATERRTVEEFTRTLQFDEEVAPSTATPGERIDLRVVDQTKTGVADVAVRSSRQMDTWQTDPDGRVSLTVWNNPGVEQFTATKDGDDFKEDDSARINVHVLN